MTNRPLVVAHRGFSAAAPENTLAAYRRAVEIKPDLIEGDVWLSADRVPMVIHDEFLTRVAGVDKRVSELTVAELKELDVGRWKGPEFTGERIPTLEEALRFLQGTLRFAVEIKGADMEAEVVATIRATGAGADDVVIFAFDYDTVVTIKERAPDLQAVWLVESPPTEEAAGREMILRARAAGAEAIGFTQRQVTPELVRLAHEASLTTCVWTANDAVVMKRLIDIGVDCIVTDHPDVLLELLGRRRR